MLNDQPMSIHYNTDLEQQSVSPVIRVRPFPPTITLRQHLPIISQQRPLRRRRRLLLGQVALVGLHLGLVAGVNGRTIPIHHYRSRPIVNTAVSLDVGLGRERNGRFVTCRLHSISTLARKHMTCPRGEAACDVTKCVGALLPAFCLFV